MKETLSLIKRVKEIDLVSQDCTQYGKDLNEKTDLKSLLERLNNIDGISG